MRAKTLLLACLTTFGLTSLAGCQEPEPDKFGIIKIELEPENATANQALGQTSEIVVTMLYQECLQDFYLKHHPEYQKDGIEGSELFADWREKLCDSDLEKVIDCEVADIDQSLIEDTSVYQLKVTYTVKDPTTLNLGYLHVGPFPTEDFASDCSLRPIAELRANGIIGRDSDGIQLWSVTTLPGSALAVAGQGAPLRVKVGP